MYNTYQLFYFVYVGGLQAVSALLHALTALSPSQFQPHQAQPTSQDNETIPVTSLTCKWKAPKAKKDSTLSIASTSFEKHDYENQ